LPKTQYFWAFFKFIIGFEKANNEQQDQLIGNDKVYFKGGSSLSAIVPLQRKLSL